MWFIIIYFVYSTLAIGLSFPIAHANNLAFVDIITDYFAFLTFSGVACGILLVIIRYVTSKHFNPFNKLWLISKKEQNFYKFIKIKKWKHIVPDFGFLVGFKKRFKS